MMNPMIFEKTKNGEFIYDIYSRLVKERILFLKGEHGIDAEDATTMAATMMFLDSQGPKEKKKDIAIYVNSPGGAVHSGMWTILDTMEFISSPIKTVCIGEAYSAASLVLMAGTKGKRKAYPHARIMVHNVQAGTRGDLKDMKKHVDMFNRSNQEICQFIMKCTGQSEEEVEKVMNEETYFTAKEALEWGIIDEIVEPKSFEQPKVTL